jgi:phospholipid transport system substrate-binding protein
LGSEIKVISEKILTLYEPQEDLMIPGSRLYLCISLVVGMLWAASALAAPPGAATSAIQQSIDQLIEVLKDPELKKSENKDKRRSEILRVIRTRFDFSEIARRSMGTHWRELKGADRDEFINLFSQLLEETYIGKIEQYADEKIVYKSEESIGPDQAEVRTVIVTSKAEIPIYYRCMVMGKEWKVYDVVIEGVSLVSNYRSQFDQIILKESLKGLMARLRTKVREVRTVQ